MSALCVVQVFAVTNHSQHARRKNVWSIILPVGHLSALYGFAQFVPADSPYLAVRDIIAKA